MRGRGSRGSRRPLGARLRGSDWPVLALCLGWSLIPLAVLLVRKVPFEHVLTGADGLLTSDQLQYMAWVRDLGEHGLAANLFDLQVDHSVFLHPMFLLSGLAWEAGVPIQVAFLVWKPVAVAVVVIGSAAYVRRTVHPDGWPRRAALVLALFFYPVAAIAMERIDLVAGPEILGVPEIRYLAQETFLAYHLWGYLPTVISVGLMPLFLLGTERLLEPAARRSGRGAAWYGLTTAAGGLCVSWLHPWQGATLLLVLAGIAAWGRPDMRRCLLLAGPGAATLAPLAYYYVLSESDASWRMAEAVNSEFPKLTPWVIAVGLAPLAIPAAAGLRLRAGDLQERVLALWPAAAVAVHFAVGSFPYHAFAGISLPLAVLAVRGWQRFRPAPAFAIIATLVLTLPGVVANVQDFRRARGDPQQLFTVTEDEHRALRHLERVERPGGVLTPARLGQAVPGFTGRDTWVGHGSWTPTYVRRVDETERLFNGSLPEPRARRLVRATGATMLLSDCHDRADLGPVLEPFGVTTRRFGCVAVYELSGRHRVPARTPPS
jgi:hypothetical protein